MSRFITYPISVDARDLIAAAFAYLQTKNPNWEPSEGQPDTWIIEATGSEAADIGTLASQVPKDVFRTFGEQLFGIAPIDTQSATMSIDIFAVDNAGYTVPAGTQVGVQDAFGNLVAFTTVSDAVIAAGTNEVDNVLCVAAVGGSASNNVGVAGGAVQLLDVMYPAFIDHITQVAPSIGGQDAEAIDDYLNRLSLELQTMSPRPILPGDFSILARDTAGVQRATTIDGYNPADDTFDNERMVTVFGLDDTGQPVVDPVKTNMKNDLDAMREVNFVVNAGDADLNDIDITAHFTVLPSYDLTDVQSRVYAAIQTYTDPSLWGIADTDDPNDPKTWINETTIYYLELSTIINNVPGVDRITLLQIGPHGGALAADDYVMAGVAPLPSPQTITVIGSYV